MNISKQLLDVGLRKIAEMRSEALSKLSEDARAQIESRSKGRLAPRVTITDDKAIIYVQKTDDDPTGSKVKKIELESQAFSTTISNLRNEAYVKNLLKQK